MVLEHLHCLRRACATLVGEMQVTITIDIPESHVVTLPSHLPVGRARLTVEVIEPSSARPSRTVSPAGTDIDALVALLQTFPPTGRTRDQVDQSLLDERAAWDS